MTVNKKSLICAMTAFVSFIVSTIHARVIDLPKTGQTKCYDVRGNEITCNGTGQDADIQAGVPWPNPRFTDNGDGTVTDRLTGLSWSKNASITVRLTWQQALNYVVDLNEKSHLGQKDLPNELVSLVDFGQHSPALPPGAPFQNVGSLHTVWSSTTSAPFPGSGSVTANVLFDFPWIGGVDNVKTNSLLLWPVRSPSQLSLLLLPKTNQTTCYDASGRQIRCRGTGQDGEIQAGIPWPNPRFTDDGDGTVTDKLTGLIWMSDLSLARGKTWQNALGYVASLNQGVGTYGHKDWRLPNVNELLSLSDYGRLPIWTPYYTPFKNADSYFYWSSTTYAFHPNEAYCASSLGGISACGKSESTNPSGYVISVLPVRGGLIVEQPAQLMETHVAFIEVAVELENPRFPLLVSYP